MSRRGVFLDRDGTIIRDRHYLADPGEVVLIPGAAEAIRRLAAGGYLVVMVSNQSGVARGMFPEAAVVQVNRRVQELLEREGAFLDGVYYCPHHPDGTVAEYRRCCGCRKPAPGMGLRAAREHGILLSESYMIGDKAEDVQFGKSCGMKDAFLVATGHGGEYTLSGGYGTAAEDILRAAEMILERDRKE